VFNFHVFGKFPISHHINLHYHIFTSSINIYVQSITIISSKLLRVLGSIHNELQITQLTAATTLSLKQTNICHDKGSRKHIRKDKDNKKVMKHIMQ